MKLTFAFLAVILLVSTLFVPAENDRKLTKTIIVNAPIKNIYDAWTTEYGVQMFFAPAANIQLRQGGAYEIFFFPDAEPGLRGADGMRILEFMESDHISFTWNAPPMFPAIRNGNHHTRVTVSLEVVDITVTKVTLVQDRWLTGGNWDKVYDYFDKAWDLVLARLKHSFEVAPIDWSNPWRPE